MAMTVADQLLERLREWGVHRVYGYPGDGINAILGAFDRAGNDPELLQVRHEEMAAFMACAHAKFTGQVGVCTATSGPGAIHLLNGLYDAKLDHQPVLAIVGQQAATSLGGHYQQEVDLISLFKDVASEYVTMITEPQQLPMAVDRALRIAAAQRRLTCLILPNDQFLPEYGQARGVQIDIDPRMIGIRYPMEVNLVGDAKETLAALLPLLERKEDRAWREQIESNMADWWKLVEDRAMTDADP